MVCCPSENILQSNDIKIKPRSSAGIIMFGSMHNTYSEVEKVKTNLMEKCKHSKVVRNDTKLNV